MTTRPPLPPFTREAAIQKVRLAEDVGIRVTRKKLLWPTRSIRAGGTAQNL